MQSSKIKNKKKVVSFTLLLNYVFVSLAIITCHIVSSIVMFIYNFLNKCFGFGASVFVMIILVFVITFILTILPDFNKSKKS